MLTFTPENFETLPSLRSDVNKKSFTRITLQVHGVTLDRGRLPSEILRSGFFGGRVIGCGR